MTNKINTDFKFAYQLITTYSNMAQYRLIYEYLLIEKPVKDVTDAIK